MNRKESSRPHGAALLLPMFFLAACAQHTPQPAPLPKVSGMSEGYSAMQIPARAIIHFQHSATDSKVLSNAIAKACHCQPVFFRPYLGDALIYEIVLPPGRTFAAFAEVLMRDATELGIKAVEQDSVMQHQ